MDQTARARKELEKLMGQASGSVAHPRAPVKASGVGQSAGAPGQSAGDVGVYAWRGAVTNGSKEAGFKILLNKTKELPGNDKRGKITRKLNFNATIVADAPK